VALYHQQLSYCIIQYIEKDPDTAVAVLQGLLRFWPWSCSSKQVGREGGREGGKEGGRAEGREEVRKGSRHSRGCLTGPRPLLALVVLLQAGR